MKLAPKNQESYLFLGTLYAKQGNYTKAEGIFKQLIALDMHASRFNGGDPGRLSESSTEAGGAGRTLSGYT